MIKTLRLELYIPRNLLDIPEVKEMENLLNEVESSLKLKVGKHISDEEEERELKSQILWGVSVAKRIRIKQTRRTKSLYPQLVVFGGDKVITFYPQSRAQEEITIQDFLKGLLKKEVRCLHEKYEIEDELRKKSWRQ